MAKEAALSVNEGGAKPVCHVQQENITFSVKNSVNSGFQTNPGIQPVFARREASRCCQEGKPWTCILNIFIKMENYDAAGR